MAAKVLARLFVATAVIFFSTSLHSADPKQRIVLEFTDSHCPACRQMQPAVDQLVGQGWVIRQVHRAYEVELFQRWRVQQTPTLIVLQDGREVDRVVGAMNYDRLLRRLTDDGSIEPRVSGRDNQPYNQSTNLNSQVQNNQGPIVRGQSPLSASAMIPLASIASSSDRNMFDDRSEGLSPVRSASDFGRGQSQDFGNLDPNDQDLRRRSDPMESTVRIVVDDGSSESVGTGTIIDTHGNEALVLTCGHLFRDSGGKATIYVDLFVGGRKQRASARVVDYRADQVDIGLISFQYEGQLPVAEIRPSHEPLRENEVVFSIGCDAGADPSRRDSRITKLNRYLGPENIEAAGAPVQGRSGGGLFDAQGRLIGVCYAADQEWNEGLYAGPQVVYAQLDRIGLQRLARR